MRFVIQPRRHGRRVQRRGAVVLEPRPARSPTDPRLPPDRDGARPDVGAIRRLRHALREPRGAPGGARPRPARPDRRLRPHPTGRRGRDPLPHGPRPVHAPRHAAAIRGAAPRPGAHRPRGAAGPAVARPAWPRRMGPTPLGVGPVAGGGHLRRVPTRRARASNGRHALPLRTPERPAAGGRRRDAGPELQRVGHGRRVVRDHHGPRPARVRRVRGRGPQAQAAPRPCRGPHQPRIVRAAGARLPLGRRGRHAAPRHAQRAHARRTRVVRQDPRAAVPRDLGSARAEVGRGLPRWPPHDPREPGRHPPLGWPGGDRHRRVRPHGVADARSRSRAHDRRGGRDAAPPDHRVLGAAGLAPGGGEGARRLARVQAHAHGLHPHEGRAGGLLQPVGPVLRLRRRLRRGRALPAHPAARRAHPGGRPGPDGAAGPLDGGGERPRPRHHVAVDPIAVVRAREGRRLGLERRVVIRRRRRGGGGDSSGGR